MSSKHFPKYFQKYHIFFSFAILLLVLYACSTTSKVPKGQYLLTKNHFEYKDDNEYKDEIPNFAAQKPNKKDFLIIPTRLLIYNLANPKYDSIVSEYMTFPSTMRTEKLRDSLFIKYKHPEFVGKSIFWSKLFHTLGKPPVILDEGKTASSAEKMRQFLVFKGYWDARVDYATKKDSAAKKAQNIYKITYKDPTFIKDYTYKIPYDNIRALYEDNLKDSYVKSGKILNQTNLENEVKRITEKMQENGFYTFNKDGGEIFFTADTLTSRKLVPLTIQIQKDSINSPYKKYTIGDIDVEYVNKITDKTTKDTLYRGINIKRIDEQYKIKTLWRPITLKKGEIFNQTNLNLSKRNIIAMNNFSIADYRETVNPNDTVINVKYRLIPLPKYNFKTSFDLHYSQILNLGFSPSAELTARNIFGGAENLTTSVSGTFGTVYTQKNPKAFLNLNASEFSLQFGLNFPRLLLPFNTENFVPNKYSPVSTISLGVSAQNNIGMDRRIFNAGFNYFVNIGDRVSHKLSLFNTQLSITRNKSAYYDYFPADYELWKQVSDKYFVYNPSVGSEYDNGNGTLTKDDVTNIILADNNYINSLTTEEQQIFLNYLQVLYKKERITQNVLINSLFYNFTYNEIGKKDYQNPFFFDGKIELAGNLLSLLSKKNITSNNLSVNSGQIFGIPISQFVKFDVDIRKYFTFSNKHQFIIRQVAGVGIPYGNSSNMPFVRSYFSGGSNDVRAWIAFGGLGPADSDVDKRVRAYMMGNVKLTTNIEYRFPINNMFEGAIFTDAGNIWSLKDTGIGDEFKFNKFVSQMGLGSGLGLRIHVAYITVRLDLAYKLHDPNNAKGERWVIDKIQPLKPTFNFSIGYPF
jgi:outer membrane protein assembly factor BamA